MTQHRVALTVVAVAAAAYGLVSLVGAVAVEEIQLPYRITAALAGVMLVLGAWLVWQVRFTGAVLLWLSALIYLLQQLLPAVQRHGTAAFSALVGAFYVSLAIRVGLAALGHYFVRQRHG